MNKRSTLSVAAASGMASDMESQRHESDHESTASVKNSRQEIQMQIYNVRCTIKDEDWFNIP